MRALCLQMLFPTNSRRADEKLAVILREVTSVRRRLNSLAVQRGVFFSLAILIAAGAVTYLAAALLSPLAFLSCAIVAAVALATGLWRSVASARGIGANLARAARVADERAELKGRLLTIVEMSSNARLRPLWSFLVEDTIGRREEFAPGRIVRRRISRSLFALAGALLFAGFAIPLARTAHAPGLAANSREADITLDLDQLQLRPADADGEGGLEVQADAATMRRLDEKLAREGMSAGAGTHGSIDNLLNRARSLAGKVQNRLRGPSANKPRLTLKLADAGTDQNSSQRSDNSEPWRNGGRHEQTGQFKQEHDESYSPLPGGPLENDPAAGSTPGDSAGGGGEIGGSDDSPVPDSDAARRNGDDQRGEQQSNGGASHGIGADPQTLFGAQVDSKLGNEGFEIAIEARPLEHGAGGAGRAYLPPKVRTPLNAHQRRDEPVARAAVPPDDRATIKRVFER